LPLGLSNNKKVKVVPGASFTKTTCDLCSSLQKEMLLQTLSWRCVESVIYQEWDVREEQHTHLRDANKQ